MLIAHQTNGCSSFIIKNQACSRAVKLKYLVDLQQLRRTDKFAFLKPRFPYSGRAIVFSKEKHFKVSSFKGNDHSNVADDVGRDSKCSKKQVQLSLSTQEREDAEVASTDSALSMVPSASLNGKRSQGLEKLLKRWLSMLTEKTADSVENQEKTIGSKSGHLAKSFLLWFMGLDAILKIPLLIFVPWYFIVRVSYGIEITRELTPLWTIGPLLTALYIKTIQGIFSLYIFCFKKAIEFLENLPSHYALVRSYLVEGKLREFLNMRLYKPIVDIKNADYKALSRLKMKHLRDWTVEKYLDFVESIWPYYCRTIRFLKKANLL